MKCVNCDYKKISCDEFCDQCVPSFYGTFNAIKKEFCLDDDDINNLGFVKIRNGYKYTLNDITVYMNDKILTTDDVKLKKKLENKLKLKINKYESLLRYNKLYGCAKKTFGYESNMLLEKDKINQIIKEFSKSKTETFESAKNRLIAECNKILNKKKQYDEYIQNLLSVIKTTVFSTDILKNKLNISNDELIMLFDRIEFLNWNGRPRSGPGPFPNALIIDVCFHARMADMDECGFNPLIVKTQDIIKSGVHNHIIEHILNSQDWDSYECKIRKMLNPINENVFVPIDFEYDSE